MTFIVFSDIHSFYHSILWHGAVPVKTRDTFKCWKFNKTCLLKKFIDELLAPGVEVELMQAIYLKTE